MRGPPDLFFTAIRNSQFISNKKSQKARAQIMATRRRPFEMKTAKRAHTA